MSSKLIAAGLSLATLGALHASLVGKDKPTKFPSKVKGQEVLLAKLAEAGKVLIVIDDDGTPEVIDAPTGFVKATKEELGAMDKAERSAYRKARRKAARERRKAA
jgi:hypothetical protein